jgi:ubiquitin carboxyl-terminal hydrolase 25
MDNCIFQIEAALEFDEKHAESSKDGSRNIVKRCVIMLSIFCFERISRNATLNFIRLFYGRKRQRILPAADDEKPKPSVSEKEDIFAQLLVNVSDDGMDLYDGLSGFMDDTIDFEGKQAKMEVDLLELPPILQIQLQVCFSEGLNAISSDRLVLNTSFSLTASSI